jgi:hypothetical protein
MINLVHLSDDLMDHSRITAALPRERFSIRWIKAPGKLSESIGVIIINLHLIEDFLTIENTCLKVGYASHVDAQRLKAARNAGFDVVMPRSQFFESFNEEWLQEQLAKKASRSMDQN